MRAERRRLLLLGSTVLVGCGRPALPPPTSPPAPPVVAAPTTPTAGLVVRAPERPRPARRVTVRRVVTHHLPGPLIPPAIPRPTGAAQPWLTPLPTRDVAWRPAPAPAPDPLAAALAAALARGGGDLPGPDGPVRLALPAAGDSPGTALRGTRPVVIAPADASWSPRGVAGWTWRELAVEAPGGVAYLGAVGAPLPLVGRGARGQRAAVVGLGVRAGWLARRAEALALLRAVLVALGADDG
jgi:hypothetical protein